jgi:ribosome recycling factor
MTDTKQQMDKAVEFLKTEFSRLRVGRASLSMLDGVKLEVYGSQVGLKEVAALATPDARSITITAWDKSVVPDIEKAILAANLGLTPINDGKLIRISLPPLTEDRRKDFVKQIKKFGEDAKISVRNIRRDANESFKAKKDELGEDGIRRSQEEVQKLTDKYTAEIEKLVETKTNEVMTI